MSSAKIVALEAEVKEYNVQLEAVVLSLQKDPGNGELQSLKTELEEAITLTESAISELKLAISSTNMSWSDKFDPRGSQAGSGYVERLIRFHEQEGNRVGSIPSIDGRLIDLCKLKELVEARGGFANVCRNEKWTKIARDLNYNKQILPWASSTLRDVYSHWVVPYEESLKSADSGEQVEDGGILHQTDLLAPPQKQDANGQPVTNAYVRHSVPHKSDASAATRRRPQLNQQTQSTGFPPPVNTRVTLLDPMPEPSIKRSRLNTAYLAEREKAPAEWTQARQRKEAPIRSMRDNYHTEHISPDDYRASQRQTGMAQDNELSHNGPPNADAEMFDYDDTAIDPQIIEIIQAQLEAEEFSPRQTHLMSLETSSLSQQAPSQLTAEASKKTTEKHVCGLCEHKYVAFGTIGDLRRHRNGVHCMLEDRDKFWQCTIEGCASADKKWPRRDKFQSHLKREHYNGDDTKTRQNVDNFEKVYTQPENLLDVASPLMAPTFEAQRNEVVRQGQKRNQISEYEPAQEIEPDIMESPSDIVATSRYAIPLDDTAPVGNPALDAILEVQRDEKDRTIQKKPGKKQVEEEDEDKNHTSTQRQRQEQEKRQNQKRRDDNDHDQPLTTDSESRTPNSQHIYIPGQYASYARRQPTSFASYSRHPYKPSNLTQITELQDYSPTSYIAQAQEDPIYQDFLEYKRLKELERQRQAFEHKAATNAATVTPSQQQSQQRIVSTRNAAAQPTMSDRPGFLNEQLWLLRDQIQAFKLLSKKMSLPLPLQEKVFPRKPSTIPPVDVFQAVERVINNGNEGEQPRKIRAGCIACKARRVKCGQERPICKSCRVLDRTCYYTPIPELESQGTDIQNLDDPKSLLQSETRLSGLSSLTIGSWRRVRSRATDFVVSYSAHRERITYSIKHDSVWYKIKYPFSLIKNMSWQQGSSCEIQVDIELEKPPSFFVRRSGGDFKCGDFTEDQQGSLRLTHNLSGYSGDVVAQLEEFVSLPSYKDRFRRVKLPVDTKSNAAVDGPHSSLTPLPVPSNELDGLSNPFFDLGMPTMFEAFENPWHVQYQQNLSAAPSGTLPPKVPEGWTAIWVNTRKNWLYVNVHTRQPRWDMPTAPALDSNASQDALTNSLARLLPLDLEQNSTIHTENRDMNKNFDERDIRGREGLGSVISLSSITSPTPHSGNQMQTQPGGEFELDSWITVPTFDENDFPIGEEAMKILRETPVTIEDERDKTNGSLQIHGQALSGEPMDGSAKTPTSVRMLNHSSIARELSTSGGAAKDVTIAGAPTDSGYASITRDKPKTFIHAADDTDLTDDHPDHNDAKTVYSDGNSVETSQRDNFIDRLAELLEQDLKDVTVSNIAVHEIFEDIKDCLADFALRLGQESCSPKLRRAMAFVHKYRELVGSSFQSLVQQGNNEEEDRRQEATENMPLGELISRWFRDETTESPGPPLEDLVAVDDEVPMDDPILHNNPDELKIYSDLILASESYKWLTSKLRNKVLLTYEDSHACKTIKKVILDIIPKELVVKVATVSKVVQAVFLVEWPLKEFLDAQLESCPETNRLGHIVSLTGSPPDIQVMTCNDYMRQTWPTTGLYLIQAIEESLRNEELAAVVQRPDGALLSAVFEESLCTVSVSGSRDMIVELAEQLAWLAAALRVSPNIKDIMTCSPVIDVAKTTSNVGDLPETLDKLHMSMESRVETNIFELNFEFLEVETQSRNGNCWQHVLPHCSIVSGFPIRRRAKDGLGMEISLNIMAGLVGTKRVNQYRETIFIRGFSAIYSPTRLIDDTIMWHLTCDKTGGHVSYRDVPKDIAHVQLIDLEAKRHVVGWCAKIADRVGTDDTVHSVVESQLPGTRPGCVLDNFLLTFPKEILYGPTFALLQCQKSIHLASATYRAKLKYLKDHLVLLWDTEDDRGWLTNFLAAFLHLVRDTFVSYDAPIKAVLMVLWDRLRLVAQSVSATQGLEPTLHCSAWPSIDCGVYPSADKDDLSVASIARQIFTRVCDQLFDGVDKLITFQEQVEYDDSRRTRRSLRLLEGWSFTDLASEHGPKRARVMSLPTIAFTWAKLLRSLGTVTIFGERFGELISPCTPLPQSQASMQCRDEVQALCQNLESDRFLVAVAMRDLRIKLRKFKHCSGALLIGDAAILPRYASAFTNCVCRPDHDRCTHDSKRSILMPWPAAYRKLLPVVESRCRCERVVNSRDFADRYINGAVIFGHDDEAGYHLDETGNPVKGMPPDPSIEQEEAFNDSGFGTDSSRISQENIVSSITSRSTDEISAQDSGNFQDKTQSYKDSVVHGGAPVYGNIYVTNHNNMTAATQNSYLGMRSMSFPDRQQLPVPSLRTWTPNTSDQNQPGLSPSGSQHRDSTHRSKRSHSHDGDTPSPAKRRRLTLPSWDSPDSQHNGSLDSSSVASEINHVDFGCQDSSSQTHSVDCAKRCCRCRTLMKVENPTDECEECVHEFCIRCGVLEFGSEPAYA